MGRKQGLVVDRQGLSDEFSQVPRKLIRIAVLGSMLFSFPSCGGDTQAPPSEGVDFENMRVEELAADRAVIRFETSRATTCEVLFGFVADSLDQRATDPEMEEGQFSLEHQVPLEDLESGTTYHFRARAVDAWGQEYFSVLNQLTTDAQPGAAHSANLALLSSGASVVEVSSNWGSGDNDSTYGADRAFDGKMATDWSSDGDGDSAFLEIELAAASTVTAIAFRSREMSDGSAIIHKVEFHLNPGDHRIGPLLTPNPAERYRLDFAAIPSVERVRLVVLESTGGNTGARELEVYGPTQ